MSITDIDGVIHPVTILKTQTKALAARVSESRAGHHKVNVGFKINQTIDEKSADWVSVGEDEEVFELVMSGDLEVVHDMRDQETKEEFSHCEILAHGEFVLYINKSDYESHLDEAKEFLKVNITALLYSYARIKIEQVTADFPGGKIMLPTINAGNLEFTEDEEEPQDL